MGIDPGSRYTGYGLVHKQGSALRLVAAGRISAKASLPFEQRLKQIYQGLTAVIEEFHPDMAAVEAVFHQKNVRSAVQLGHARGVALLAAANADLPVFEYPPATVKMSVVGYGRAAKDQVGLMVCQLLGISQSLPEDAADACAAAICHINQIPFLQGKAAK